MANRLRFLNSFLIEIVKNLTRLLENSQCFIVSSARRFVGLFLRVNKFLGKHGAQFVTSESIWFCGELSRNGQTCLTHFLLLHFIVSTKLFQDVVNECGRCFAVRH